MFIAYAAMYVSMWACSTMIALHFENPWWITVALIGSFFLPTFSRNHKNNDSKDPKEDPLNLNK